MFPKRRPLRLLHGVSANRISRGGRAKWQQLCEGLMIVADGEPGNAEVVTMRRKWLQPPGFFVFNADHAETLRRNGRTRLGAIFEFVETVDIRGLEFAAANIEQSANHFAHHVAEKRAAAHGEDELLIIGGAHKFGGVN